jgi:glutamate synthase domain-containing protein 3
MMLPSSKRREQMEKNNLKKLTKKHCKKTTMEKDRKRIDRDHKEQETLRKAQV